MESGKEFFCVCFVEWKKNGMEVEWKVEWKIFINAKESGKWNGMESGKENFYSCYVERKKMEWRVEWKWNGII